MTNRKNDHPHNAFSLYVNNELDMDDIDGMSCSIVHPIVAEVLKMCGNNPDWRDGASQAEQQVASCMAGEYTEKLVDRHDQIPGLDLVDYNGEDRLAFHPDVLAVMLSDLGHQMCLSLRAVAERLGLDDESLRMPTAFLIQQVAFIQFMQEIERGDDADGERLNQAAEQISHLIDAYSHLLEAIAPEANRHDDLDDLSADLAADSF